MEAVAYDQIVDQDIDEVLGFFENLDSVSPFEDVQELFYALRKPWKYQIEYEFWQQCGKPNNDDDKWPDFVKMVEDFEGV